MREIVIGAAQMGAIQRADSRAEVVARMNALLDQAKSAGCDLVVFPETVTTGFDTGLSVDELWELVDDVPGKLTETIQARAKELGVHVVWPTYRRGGEKGRILNASILIGPDGNIIGIYDKTHPFPGERKEFGGWTEAGTSAEVYETEKDAAMAVRQLALLSSAPPAELINEALAFALEAGYQPDDLVLMRDLGETLSTWNADLEGSLDE